jgi:hypothetical protein
MAANLRLRHRMIQAGLGFQVFLGFGKPYNPKNLRLRHRMIQSGPGLRVQRGRGACEGGARGLWSGGCPGRGSCLR